MRTIGIALIVVGILMFAFNGINYQTEKRVADIGPIKIDKKENNYLGWPTYAGGLTALSGVILVIAAGRRKS